ncbi:hypothetical protein P154DRAFT_570263 [Amniculicola lignicola CBS 123094]|uniref:Uncharacterized protein n=1 Tax=Amniculicola lignicola CBS 123094 TaxID=1392246 RepID=A0A6A5WWK6_9PLEO|nr:hypothetical protein P154DRAFT_570263 [Amniculicola lignicola CBS 123094]
MTPASAYSCKPESKMDTILWTVHSKNLDLDPRSQGIKHKTDREDEEWSSGCIGWLSSFKSILTDTTAEARPNSVAPRPTSTTQKQLVISVLSVERRETRTFIKAYTKVNKSFRWEVYAPQWYSLEEFYCLNGAAEAMVDFYQLCLQSVAV